jgi:DNA-binding transcriptional MocR family regulator
VNAFGNNNLVCIALDSIDLVSRALSDMGDKIWIEDPAYWGMRNTLRINGE